MIEAPISMDTLRQTSSWILPLSCSKYDVSKHVYNVFGETKSEHRESFHVVLEHSTDNSTESFLVATIVCNSMERSNN